MAIRGKMERTTEDIISMRIATILDCEGWITLEKISKSRGVGLCLTLGVGNTNPILTDWLKKTFGGSVYNTKRKSIKHKDYWTWRVNGNRASEILKRCIPFMMLKVAQAELAIAFQEAMHSRNTHNEPCTPEYLEKMWEFKRQLTLLNRKGKELPSPAETKRDDPKPVLVTGREAIVRTPEETGRVEQKCLNRSVRSVTNL